MYSCANCGLKGCSEGDLDKTLPNCPSKEKTFKKKQRNYIQRRKIKIAHNAAIVEAEGYGVKTRVEEIISFAKKCEYKRIGLVFCMGLINEAKCFADILKHHGFDIISVLCKNGGIENHTQELR